jgi:hypothetical protein
MVLKRVNAALKVALMADALVSCLKHLNKARCDREKAGKWDT